MALEAGTTESEIKDGVEKVLGGRRIDVWAIGTTDNLDIRRERHGRPTIWHYWIPDTEQTAKNVEAYFKDKGMKGYTGEDESAGKATYVYITW